MATTAVPTATERRFAVDWMLGRLARWLRILGHDVAWGPHLRRETLLASARRDGRLVVTRDTRLARRRNLPPLVLLHADRFRDQLRELAAVVPLGDAPVLRRCLDCNRPLVEVAADAVRDRVPSYVLATQSRFWRCPACDNVLWPATHHAHMAAELRALGLAGEGSLDGER